MDFVGAIKSGFQNYVTFRGVASRSEYWYWVLFTTLLSIVSNAIDYNSDTAVFSFAVSLVVFLPSLAVAVRRLRDAGFSWMWLLTSIPGTIATVVGLFGLTLALIAFGLTTNLFTTTEDPSFISNEIQLLLADPNFVGYFVTFLAGLALLFAYLVVVQIIFMVQPSKSFEQGNKYLAPKNPTI